MPTTQWERLGRFFAECPIITQNCSYDDEPLKPDKMPYAMCFGSDYNYKQEDFYLLNFTREGTLEWVARKGLSWTNKRAHINFGINYTALSLNPGDFNRIALRDRPHLFNQDFGKKQRFVLKFETLAKNPVYLEDQFDKAGEIITAWTKDGKMPSELESLLQESREGERLKICRMLGSQTYHIRGNNNLGEETRNATGKFAKLKEEHYEKVRSMAFNGEDSVSLEKLDSVIGLTAGIYSNCRIRLKGIDFSTFKRDLTEPDEKPDNYQELLTATRAIAKAAYSIRQEYPKKGQEVRTGIVHPQSYKKLEKLASQEANPEAVSEILKINRDARKQLSHNWDYKELLESTFKYWIGWINPMPENAEVLKNIERANPLHDGWQHYEKIGLSRFNDFSERCVTPYKREARVLRKVLRYYLNRKQFEQNVNLWLGHFNFEEVEWKKLE